MFQLAVLLSLAAVGFCAPPPANTNPMLVNTEFGPVQGLLDGRGAYQWLGIPFGHIPARFAAPQDPAPYAENPYPADVLKPTCIQYSNTTVSDGGVESEDCLYINVWAPAKKAPAGGWPVMFWIYGGDLTSGSGSVPGYDGSHLANDREVVIVNHNYRLNVFGFPNAPQLPKNEGNPGFLDQRKALAWTAKNIHEFGGNPEKITIFGESAGGYSVKQLVAKPPKPLNFRAAIMESEASSEKNGPQGWASLTKALGCTDAATQLACVRSKSVAEIKSVMTGLRLGFSPVEDDTFANDVSAAMKGSNSAKVPIIIGTNANEGTYFTSRKQNQTLAQFEYAASYVTLFAFQCPVSQLAPLMAESGFPGVYRYFFNYSSAYEPFQPFKGAGAYHSIEIAPVYGNYFYKGEAQAFKQVGNAMQEAWTGFAKNPMKAPAPEWEKTTAEKRPVYVFSAESEKTVMGKQLDAACAPLDALVTSTGLKA